ncbi:hypothetical protein FRC03_002284 [Tulasnella sp. 419]|nr:hypothetical protein FRC03_002284 [Tulasnella sp. 419]
MSSQQPPDRYRNNKRQRSLNTSMQIPGTLQPSGVVVNKRPKPGLSTPEGSEIIDHAPGDLVAALTELDQLLEGLPVANFRGAVRGLLRAVGTIDINPINADTLVGVCDLVQQVVIFVVLPIREGNWTDATEILINKLTMGIHEIVTEHEATLTSQRLHHSLNVHTEATLIDPLDRLLKELLGSFTKMGPESMTWELLETIGLGVEKTLEVTRQSEARSISIQQIVSGTDRLLSEFSINQGTKLSTNYC